MCRHWRHPRGAVGHLTTVSLPDHVLPTGLNEVHGEVFRVPWRVRPCFVGLGEVCTIVRRGTASRRT